ncbi:hypothetical protein CVT25_010391 [Psilocybe cyanescens]|uniref:Uncharacterized protein n=1 Tax=Psilocybe cyanescens TaxID=93625 RepID=A0A409XP80_PSICY|nr:hypothetical protein CVT25_010391 [Psilocybe cyanescens]
MNRFEEAGLRPQKFAGQLPKRSSIRNSGSPSSARRHLGVPRKSNNVERNTLVADPSRSFQMIPETEIGVTQGSKEQNQKENVLSAISIR